MSQIKSSNDAPTTPPRLDRVVAYLVAENWQEMDDARHPGLRIFQEAVPGEEPVVIALPRTPGTPDEGRRINDALATLSALRDCTPDAIAQDIATLSSDVMIWRIPNADADHTIPLGIAASMMMGMRDLLRYGASTESEPRPYFSRVTDVGTRYMEQCRLKPTRPGSFIFEVEAPVDQTPVALDSQITHSLFDDGERQDAIASTEPFSRRVIERIVQGLHDVQAATVAGTPDALTEKYEQGFNANLCDALRGMIESVGERGLEFSVRWSPVQEATPPAQAPVRFELETARYLEKAAETLRAVERATPTVIRGKITRLGVGTTVRTITVQSNRGTVRVSLDKDDYQQACDAHRDSLSVEVTGILERGRKYQHLASVRSFLVVSTDKVP